MRLGEFVKAPGTARAVVVDLSTYIGTDTFASQAWTVPTGQTVQGSPTQVGNILTAIIAGSGDQEGCDYLLRCLVTFASGATEEFEILAKVRSGDADPRLTR